MRRFHVCQSLRGALMNWSADDWRNCVHKDDGSLMTPTEVKSAFIDELLKGHEMVPFGDPCEGFDWKTGCPGHEVEVKP